MKRKYFFDHVMKTAGTTLHTTFGSIFGSEYVVIRGMGYRQACSDYERYRMIGGHVSFYPGDRLSPDRYHVTLVRDPIERALSHFFFLQSDLHREGIALARWANLRDFVSSNDESALAVISNYQTRHYVAMEWDGKTNLSGMEQLALAKKALDRYDLVGTSDHLTDFLDVFCYECALPPAMEIPPQNVTPRPLRDSHVDRDAIERLRELNTADIELYRYATDRFRSRKRKMMTTCILDRADRGCVPSEGPSTEEESPRIERSDGDFLDVGASGQEVIASAEAPADFGTKEFEILDVIVWGQVSKSPALLTGETATIRVTFRAHQVTDNLAVGLAIFDAQNRLIYGIDTISMMQNLAVSACGVFFVDFVFRNNLGPDDYSIAVGLYKGPPGRHLSCHFRERAGAFWINGNLGFAFIGATQLHANLSYGTIEGEVDSIHARPSSTGFPTAVRFFLDPPALTEFNAVISAVSVLGRLKPFELVGIEIDITNTSAETWRSTGLRPVILGYHWLDESGDMLMFDDGGRNALPRDIGPHETCRVLATVRTPDHKGKALLQFSLLQEFVAWFDEQGVPPAELWVEIGDAP